MSYLSPMTSNAIAMSHVAAMVQRACSTAGCRCFKHPLILGLVFEVMAMWKSLNMPVRQRHSRIPTELLRNGGKNVIRNGGKCSRIFGSKRFSYLWESLGFASKSFSSHWIQKVFDRWRTVAEVQIAVTATATADEKEAGTMDSDNDYGVANADEYHDDDDDIEQDDGDDQIPIAVPVGAIMTREDDDDDVEDDDGDAGEDYDDDAEVAELAAEADESMIEADEGDDIVNDDDEEDDAGVSSAGGDMIGDDDETGSSFCGTEDIIAAAVPVPTKISNAETTNKRGRKKKGNSDLSESSTKKQKAKRESKDSINDDDDENLGKIRRISTNLTTGLTIPFRTVKRLMKNDATIGIVQNDAAIVVTAALEFFVKELARKSLQLASNNGRNIIKYEDVATVRANDRSLSFLDLLLP
jgi:histone H3/H4